MYELYRQQLKNISANPFTFGFCLNFSTTNHLLKNKKQETERKHANFQFHSQFVRNKLEIKMGTGLLLPKFLLVAFLYDFASCSIPLSAFQEIYYMHYGYHLDMSAFREALYDDYGKNYVFDYYSDYIPLDYYILDYYYYEYRFDYLRDSLGYPKDYLCYDVDSLTTVCEPNDATVKPGLTWKDLTNKWRLNNYYNLLPFVPNHMPAPPPPPQRRLLGGL